VCECLKTSLCGLCDARQRTVPCAAETFSGQAERPYCLSGECSPASTRCLIEMLPLPYAPGTGLPTPSFPIKSLFVVVDPVELWATRRRRPSAAPNPQGHCRPPIAIAGHSFSPSRLITSAGAVPNVVHLSYISPLPITELPSPSAWECRVELEEFPNIDASVRPWFRQSERNPMTAEEIVKARVLAIELAKTTGPQPKQVPL